MPQQPAPAVDSHRSRMTTLVEQMRIHYRMDRIRVSETTKDMIKYCEQNMPTDPLIYPIKENPFKEKKGCAIL